MSFDYENKKLSQDYTYIIGCDEVGRGCLAGPVVAGAVILKIDSKLKSKDIKDSKLLTAVKREELSKNIQACALAWSIGEVSQEVVDEINIHNATLLAMRRAVEELFTRSFASIPEALSASERLSGIQSGLDSGPRLGGRGGTPRYLIAIDGKFIIPDFYLDQEAIVDGDNKILSIAAASIIAKVYRDELMQKLDKKYPIYNFAQHKGYGTLFHRTMILQHGLTPIHRKSFCNHLAI